MAHCAGRTTLPPLALFFSFALPLFLCVSSVLLPVLPTFVFVRSSVSFLLLFFVRALFPCVIRSSPGPPPVFCFLQCFLTIVRHERLCFFEKKQGQKICSPLSCSVSLFLCMSWVVFFFSSPLGSPFSLSFSLARLPLPSFYKVRDSPGGGNGRPPKCSVTDAFNEETYALAANG